MRRWSLAQMRPKTSSPQMSLDEVIRHTSGEKRVTMCVRISCPGVCLISVINWTRDEGTFVITPTTVKASWIPEARKVDPNYTKGSSLHCA